MFLDNASTTPLKPEVKDCIVSLLDTYQNPSSMYQSGVNAKQIIFTARNNVAKFINANPDDIIFTSSGSASNTLAIKGYTDKNKCMVLYSPIIHKSIIKCVESLRYKIPLKVDNQGFIDMQDLKESLSINSMKKLVVIGYADSEIGTIQDVYRIVKLAHFYNAKVYIDCTGSIPTIPVDVQSLDCDILGFSAHKLGALKGTGVLYKKSDIELEPLIYGSQEQGLFGGTENIIGIASLGKSVENYDYSSTTITSRNYVSDYIMHNIPDAYLVGADFGHRLSNNLYICFKGIQGESLMTLLDINNYQVSTGSACTSGDLTPSSTLLAIGMPKQDINSCIRITFNGAENLKDLDCFCSILEKNISILRSLTT